MVNLIFKSSVGTEFNLHSFESAKLEKGNFHKVKWIPEVINKQFGVVVNRFTKDPQIFDCTFKFKGSPAHRKRLIDDFHFATEYDVAHQKTGRIYWNNQYIDCYFNVTDTHPYDESYTEVIGQFYCPYPFWIEEQFVQIRPSDGAEGEQPDYVKRYKPAYPYPYAYPYAKNATYLSVNSALDSNFKAVIYGPTQEVKFNINGHRYQINHSLRVGQIMVLDTRDTTPLDRKCYIINENGTIENAFDYRDTASSIFKKIPSGNIIFNYTRTYGIDLTIFQERSAPI